MDKIQKLKYYMNAIRWLWEHRQEPNNRQKWRRMMREVGERRKANEVD